MRIFLDTNILMDIIFQRENELEDTLKIVAAAKDGIFECAVSVLSIVNTIYVAKKYNLTETETKEALLKLAECVEILDVKGENAYDMLESSDWKDFEDGMQYGSASDYGADYIISRDKKGFVQSDITTCTSSEFIKTMGW